MSDDARAESLQEQVRRLDAENRRLILEREYDRAKQKSELQKPADAPPSWTERAEAADNFTETSLRTWRRICIVILSGLGLWVAGMLVFWPESISPTIRIIERILSSGRGFAIPALVLVTLAPRLLRLLAGLRERDGPQDSV